MSWLTSALGHVRPAHRWPVPAATGRTRAPASPATAV